MNKKVIGASMLALATVVTLASCSGNMSVIKNSQADSSTTTTSTPTSTNIISEESSSIQDSKNSNVTTSTEISQTQTSQPTNGYVAIKDTFKMNDSITKSYYDGGTKTTEQLYIETVNNCNDTVVDLFNNSGQGSGVLFGWDETYGLSYILTCFHMVEGYTSFTVKDSKGTEYVSNVVTGYPDQDLAIMAIKTPTDYKLSYASLLDESSNLYTGQTAIAIGNNDGYSHTVSDGIVSYANRVWTTSLYNYKPVNQIQISTEINGGNSGGGLFSTSGALIGITNAGVETSTSGSSVEGIKFAVTYKEMWNIIEGTINNAQYNAETFSFKNGYVDGDFEFGSSFSIGTLNSGWYSREYVLYVNSVASSNTSYSDFNVFQSSDIIKSMKLVYKDGRESKTITFENVTSTYSFYYNLYNSGLTVGDTIEFTVSKYSSSTRSYTESTVTVTLTQYIYQ